MVPLRYRFTSFTGHAYGRSFNRVEQVTLLAAAKPVADLHPFAVANEIAAARIGQHIGLPVPLIGIALADHLPGKPSWLVSLDFNDTGVPLPELNDVRRDALVKTQPSLCAGTIIFDLFVGNYDRHARNIAVLLDGSGGFKRMVLYDHDRCLLGHTPAKWRELFSVWEKNFVLDGKPPIGATRHVLLDAVTDAGHLRDWCERVASLPNWFLDQLSLDLVLYGLDAVQSRDLSTFLRDRRSKLWSIVEANRSAFTGIKSWSLT